MQDLEGKLGRVFLLRLDEGDEIPGALERFAAEKNIKHGFVILLGGIGSGRVVVGPRQAAERPLQPLLMAIEAPHEVAAIGVLAPDSGGKPILHIHGACGRASASVAGCLRPGVSAWLTAEAILYEVVGVSAVRMPDPASGVMRLEMPAAAISPPATPASTPSALPTAARAAAAPSPASPLYSEVLFLFEAGLR
ncbi:MAG: DNA-binding protein [Planctomycetota bacterium]|nr:DNA-binding protein [Planctomycetota bacterium]